MFTLKCCVLLFCFCCLLLCCFVVVMCILSCVVSCVVCFGWCHVLWQAFVRRNCEGGRRFDDPRAVRVHRRRELLLRAVICDLRQRLTAAFQRERWWRGRCAKEVGQPFQPASQQSLAWNVQDTVLPQGRR